MKTPYKLQSYQQALYDKMQAGDFNGALAVFASGRQSGKSMLNEMYGSMMAPAKFTILDQALVDGVTWYTVVCNRNVSAWVHDQPKELQYSHIDQQRTFFSNKFDVHEELYTVLALQWS